jgi:acetoin utilization deacetylase AcuC-like enzyme
MRHVVLPAIEQHRPDVILVSAGYDAHARDPLGSMQLSSDAYGAITSSLVELAERLGHGRVGLVLEGGYDLLALRESVASSVRALTTPGQKLPELAASQRGRAAIARTQEALAALRA